MHYAILSWNAEQLKWIVVFYCQEYEQFVPMCVKYPEDQGYIHMMDVRWLVGHNYEEIKLKREQAKQILAQGIK